MTNRGAGGGTRVLTEIWSGADRHALGRAHAPLFGLREHTRANVKGTDGTLVIGNRFSPDCRLTTRYAKELGKPLCFVKFPTVGKWDDEHTAHVLYFIKQNGINRLNVAGNRESKNPGIGAFTRCLLVRIMEELR